MQNFLVEHASEKKLDLTHLKYAWDIFLLEKIIINNEPSPIKSQGNRVSKVNVGKITHHKRVAFYSKIITGSEAELYRVSNI